ncbi:cbb3-type cytochrome c oxidase subunit 3 [Psychrosphaera sp. F3M07]|uniref:Cbb3-type cytochrome c oxidase subunit 3 n=1 Tax=Psychrosphaera aquimarina TaxID=2044854 RepID=A0ABU3QX12_9GAMM|nr:MULTISPECIES: cbb3-type cytochrome c oxidase subunit 3 [Psychrosphaera]MBU2918741.1 cbb3-type cytochrome c oxidase subunit 3 [Psychrosphaera sp. F3M07]MDU0111762.1 cbb3-type cytochrome c oxidase subunit 3 [Psychrosphaera aquimarina]
MDYGTYRGVYTLILMVLFLVIVYWAYNKKSKSKFDDIAQSIFEEDEVNKDPNLKEQKNGND